MTIEAVAVDPLLRIVYKEFPILGEGSVFAARAALAAERLVLPLALAAERQGQYQAFHDARR